MSASPWIVGLDIGTTKVCVLVGGLTEEQRVDVRGVGLAPSAGLRKGVIIDQAATIEAIRAALDEARAMAAEPLDGAPVYVGVTGDHLESLNRTAGVEINRDSDEILPADLELVRAAAVSGVTTGDREIVLERPREYLIDGRGGIANPVHANGRRLEVSLHIVTGQRQFLDQVRDCAQAAGAAVDSLVVEAVATGEAVCGPQERTLGCAVLDIGGGTTDMAVYLDGVLAHTASIPVGGAHVSYDLSYGLEAPYPVAEQIKLEHGCAVAELCDPNREVDYTRADGEPATVAQAMLAEICQPRMEELFELVLANLDSVGISPKQFASGVILTGGGSRLAGMASLARRSLQVAVREGQPIDIAGHASRVAEPRFSTVVGLVRCGGLDQLRRAEPPTEIGLLGRTRTFFRWVMSQFD